MGENAAGLGAEEPLSHEDMAEEMEGVEFFEDMEDELDDEFDPLGPETAAREQFDDWEEEEYEEDILWEEL